MTIQRTLILVTDGRELTSNVQLVIGDDAYKTPLEAVAAGWSLLGVPASCAATVCASPPLRGWREWWFERRVLTEEARVRNKRLDKERGLFDDDEVAS